MPVLQNQYSSARYSIERLPKRRSEAEGKKRSYLPSRPHPLILLLSGEGSEQRSQSDNFRRKEVKKEMTNLKMKLATGVASAALIATAVAPTAAFANSSVEIVGNGAGSTNTGTVSNSSSTGVSQSNSTSVNIGLDVTANSGGNRANDNTGSGGVTIDTGNATTNTTVTVGGSANTATLNLCGCPNGSDIDIRRNGAGTDNDADITNHYTASVSSTNGTGLTLGAKIRARTGRNRANRNTGPGLKEVLTGTASSTQNVTVNGSTNNVTL